MSKSCGLMVKLINPPALTEVLSCCLHTNGDLDIFFGLREPIHITNDDIINSRLNQSIGSCEQIDSGTIIKFYDGTEIFVPKIELHSNKYT